MKVAHRDTIAPLTPRDAQHSRTNVRRGHTDARHSPENLERVLTNPAR